MTPNHFNKFPKIIYQQHLISEKMQMMQQFGKTSTSAIANGVVGAGVSYWRGKQYPVSLFGLELPEYAWDGILNCAESIEADMVGDVAIPQIEKHLGGNQ